MSYFSCDKQNGTQYSKSNGKDNKMVPSIARAMEKTTKWYPV